MIDRRTFVKALGAGTAGATLACSKRYTASVQGKTAAQLSGTLDRIGLQLYTVRREMERDFDGTLARVAAIGYNEVEFAGYFGRSPADVRAALDRNGLSAPSAHIGTASALRKDWEKTIEGGKIMGHTYLTVASLAKDERRTLDDYRKVADLFNSAGESAKRSGIRFAYHNHDFEFAPVQGKIPYDILLQRTDPALVAMEMDLFWITKGGQSPLAYIKRHPGRFEMVHVKDMDGSSQQRMVDVGRGTIDFPGIFAEREKAGIRHFFVEHDNPQPSPLASAKASYDYMSRLKFQSQGVNWRSQ